MTAAPAIASRVPAVPLQPRWRPVLLTLMAVLLLHAWLLAGLPLGAGAGNRGGVRAIDVRRIVLPPAEVAAPVVAAPAEPAAAPPPAPKPPPEPVVPEPPPPLISAAVVPDEPPQGVADAASAPPAAAPLESPALAAATEATPAVVVAAPAQPGTGGELPVYATRLPPAASLIYILRRGVLSGHGELHWRPGPEGYELTIEGLAFGLPVLAWLSRGGYDSAGLAPQRFVDRRRARALRAANFQRDSARITYSGTTIEHPLAVGAQDRLSWLIQLSGIVEADPGRFGASGQQISMQVTGARGDADVWTFSVVGREVIEAGGEGAPAVETLMLRRNPRRDFDTRAEVWLDPARHHLPVRLRLTSAGDENDGVEFVLRAAVAPAPR